MNRPIRILHVLGGMDRGGVETWLMHVLRNIDRQRFHMDFLVHTNRRCAYDCEIESLGSNLHFCPKPSNPPRYARNFLRILRTQGPYDVVHSHVHHFSGFVLQLARLAGVPERIAHSHSDTSRLDTRSSFPRQLYLRWSARWIHRHATAKLAVSEQAAFSLFGPGWRAKASIVYPGLDFRPFAASVDPAEVRRELGLAPDDFIIGHVGRFVASKNHDFLLRVHAEVLKIKPEARLLLVGDGPLKDSVRATAAQLRTEKHVRFAGTRPDVARLMLGAMDVFVMPSIYEGLGLAALEAQAAGLPTVLSGGIPPEADIHCGLVHLASLHDSPQAWAQHIVRHVADLSAQERHTLVHLASSIFGIQRSARALYPFYSRSLHATADTVSAITT